MTNVNVTSLNGNDLPKRVLALIQARNDSMKELECINSSVQRIKDTLFRENAEAYPTLDLNVFESPDYLRACIDVEMWHKVLHDRFIFPVTDKSEIRLVNIFLYSSIILPQFTENNILEMVSHCTNLNGAVVSNVFRRLLQ